MRDINKFSNNVMARQLFLTLSAEVLKLPGNAARSSGVIRSWLAQKPLVFPELAMENGSGLSRRERISAEQGVNNSKSEIRNPKSSPGL